ncbi:MAG TPA: heme-binding protein [Bryobacteraceae bacterium]|nr:heme-binding protein [Bryobacteraceae bacterium]
MRIFVMALTLLAAALPGFSQLATKKALTLEAAKKLAAAAEAEARKNNWNVVICVVDDGANLLYLQRMDGTQIGSVDIAQMKARTAVKMKRPSKVLEDGVLAGRTMMLKLPDILPVEGGLPLTVDGQIIGAMGVSGVTAAQDGQIAAAGATALASMK